jgi:membrane protein implicated in regulation of membrane protease activity
MQWWAWVVLGAVLLAIELALVDAQFYLLFVGVAALVVGILGAVGISMPEWVQWIAFGMLSLLAVTVFRRKIYDLTRVHGERVTTGPAGEEVTIPVDLPPDETCRVEFRGSTWSAQNKGDHTITAESRARIINVEGLTLHVRAV